MLRTVFFSAKFFSYNNSSKIKLLLKWGYFLSWDYDFNKPKNMFPNKYSSCKVFPMKSNFRSCPGNVVELSLMVSCENILSILNSMYRKKTTGARPTWSHAFNTNIYVSGHEVFGGDVYAQIQGFQKKENFWAIVIVLNIIWPF